jgi:hypothetical protein
LEFSLRRLAYAELKVNFVEGFAVLWLRRLNACGVSKFLSFWGADKMQWDLRLTNYDLRFVFFNSRKIFIFVPKLYIEYASNCNINK